MDIEKITEAFIASPAYTEMYGRILAAIDKQDWMVVDENPLCVETCLSATYPASGAVRFDLGSDKKHVEWRLSTHVFQTLWTPAFRTYWNDNRPPDGPTLGEIERPVAVLVYEEHFKPALLTYPACIKAIDGIVAALADPARVARRDERKTDEALSRLEHGVDSLKALGWTWGAIQKVAREAFGTPEKE